jgi:hypothetical protein
LFIQEWRTFIKKSHAFGSLLFLFPWPPLLLKLGFTDVISSLGSCCGAGNRLDRPLSVQVRKAVVKRHQSEKNLAF